MRKFYNITAGYQLAQNAIEAIYNIESRFDGFEDFVGHDDISFIEKAAKPQKKTILHTFLANFEAMAIEGDLYNITHSENYEFLKFYLQKAKFPLPSWFTIEEIDKHSSELKNLVYKASEVIAVASFEILFNDREFLFQFQLKIKEALQLKDTTHPKKYFNKNGHIKRLNYMPSWLEKGIYYRDKGRCQNCFKDVTGKIYRYNKYHLDHVLPLAAGGTNDPTNFQLLCNDCNLKKSKNTSRPENAQIQFWEF